MIRAGGRAGRLARGGVRGDLVSPHTMSSQSDDAQAHSRWWRFVTGFEHMIVVVLVALLMVVVAISTIELGWMLFKDMSPWGKLSLNVEEMLELFGFFLLVLIGLELITTLKAYLGHGVVHGEVVLEVALIAVAQKVIILNTSRSNPTSLVGLASLVLALAASFWLVRTSARRPGGRDGPG
jgi:uncharacterized membrane protein (DUF373 family)